MVKKYKHISDLDGHSDIDSSGSVEINTQNTHPDNRGSNTDNVENRLCKQRSSFIPCTKSHNLIWRGIHTLKKTYEGGEDTGHMQWTSDGLCICRLCVWTLCKNFVCTLDEAFFGGIEISI